MRIGVGQCRLISPVIFTLYVNDMTSPSHHVDLAFHANETHDMATSRKPTPPFSYLESYLNDLQRRMSEWIIAINISKCTAIFFTRAGRRFAQPRPLTLVWEPIELSTHLLI